MEDNNKPLIIQGDETFVRIENNRWNGGICDCFNNMYPSMVCSLFTPWLYSSIMYQHITKKKFIYNPLFIYLFLNFTALFVTYYYKFLGSILFYIANFYILCVANFVRTNIRIKNEIPGSSCEDSFLTVFCLPCSLSQSARTLYSYDTVCDEFVCDSNNVNF